MNWAKIIGTSTVSAVAALGLALGLSSGPAQAHCKGKHTGEHEHCTGDPGGDLTYSITITDGVHGLVAAGDGIEGSGGTIQGITDSPSFDTIELGSISTIDPQSNVADSFNDICSPPANAVQSSESIDNIDVQHNAEIDEIVVVVAYGVEDHRFTLLLQGGLDAAEVFPPSETTSYDLIHWNNRGGGKGKKNRCGSGPMTLDGGVTLEIVVPLAP